MRAYIYGIGLLGAVLLVEMCCRIHYHRTPTLIAQPTEFEHDARSGWRVKAGVSGFFTHGEYPVLTPVKANRDGFRDTDWDEKLKDTDAKRILLIGDSMLYGWALEAHQRVSEVLAAIYKHHNISAAVFNAGIPGYSISNQFRILPELLRRINPHIVIHVACTNDVAELAVPWERNNSLRVYRPFYNETGDLILNERVPLRPSLAMGGTPLGRLSVWYAFDDLMKLRDRMWVRKFDLPSNQMVRSRSFEGFLWNEELRSRFPRVEQTYFALLGKTKQLVEASGAQFWITAGHFSFEEYLRRFATISKNVISSHPPLEDQLGSWRFQLPFDGHPNLLWTSSVASNLFRALEVKLVDWNELDQFRLLPHSIELTRPESIRFLAGDWSHDSEGHLVFGRHALFLVRHSPRLHSTLQVVAKSVFAQASLMLFNDKGSLICRLNIDPVLREHQCSLGEEGSLFFEVTQQGSFGLPLPINVQQFSVLEG